LSQLLGQNKFLGMIYSTYKTPCKKSWSNIFYYGRLKDIEWQNDVEDFRVLLVSGGKYKTYHHKIRHNNT